MSQFEYIMIMVSLILALAVAQALRGLSEVVISEKRYWPHTVWVTFYGLLVIQNWWAYWDYNVVEEWRFATYLFILINPIMLFASVYLLVPGTRSSDIDWTAHLCRVRRWLYGLGFALVTVSVTGNVIYLGLPWLHPYRIFQALIGALYLLGLLTRYEKVHKAIPLLVLTTLVISQLIIRSKIGALMTD
jgi:hypothetical protein